MVRGVYVKPLDLDRSLARDHWRCCIEPQLNVCDQYDVGFGDPRLAARLTNLRELQSVAVCGCTMQLPVRSGVRLCECSAEGSFGEDRKLPRVIFLSSPNPNRSPHQSTPLCSSLPERPINHLLLGQWFWCIGGYFGATDSFWFHSVFMPERWLILTFATNYGADSRGQKRIAPCESDGLTRFPQS